jgi:hypothetical protein
MRASTPLAAAGRQQALVATNETAPRLRRPQPSSSSLQRVAIDLASARRRRRSLTATFAVPSAKATTTTTTTTTASPSTSSVHSPSSSSSSSAHKASTSSTPTSSSSSRPIPLDQLPRPLRDSVVVLSAPNSRAPGGQTPVYVLGVSHVSKRSLDRVRLPVFLFVSVRRRRRFALS